MITIIDEEAGTVRLKTSSGEQVLDIASREAFEAASKAWLRVGWDTKYVYSFSWFGRPIIQLPDDMIRIQEVIYRLKPDLIIETGIAHGGSLVFYASILRLLGKGRVVGVDIDIRKPSRDALEQHEFCPEITLIEGNSIDPAVDKQVGEHARNCPCVLVILDSKHTFEHVLSEIEIYSKYVSVGSYIIVTDGIMENVVGAPRSQDDWATNNPRQAALQFARSNSDFKIIEPAWPFNESVLSSRVTYWPDAYLERIR